MEGKFYSPSFWEVLVPPSFILFTLIGCRPSSLSSCVVSSFFFHPVERYNLFPSLCRSFLLPTSLRKGAAVFPYISFPCKRYLRLIETNQSYSLIAFKLPSVSYFCQFPLSLSLLSLLLFAFFICCCFCRQEGVKFPSQLRLLLFFFSLSLLIQ